MVEDVECVHIGHDECVDEWFEVVDNVDSIQIGDVGCVDEVLEEVEDLTVVHVVDAIVDETDAVDERN